MEAGGTKAMVIPVGGVLPVLLALLADTIGAGRVPGFGWKQTHTLPMGLALMGIGWVVKR